MSASDKVSQNGTITITNTITNTGETDSGEFYTGYYIHNEKKIADNMEFQSPIYGDKIFVAKNNYHTGRDIYMYDFSTCKTTPICTAPGDQYFSGFYGDILVWQDDRNSDEENSIYNMDIYMYDISNPVKDGVPICTAPNHQYGPQIYGNIIVWYDERNRFSTGYDIYMYDLSNPVTNGTAICTAPGDQQAPEIYGDIIVWGDHRNGSDYDLYMYDLSNPVVNGTPVCTAPGNQYSALIYGYKIVWHDERNFASTGFDIYMYDLSNPVPDGTAICIAPGFQVLEKIYDDMIVWTDNRNGDWDIYMNYLSNPVLDGIPICTAPGDQRYPDICGDKIVWQDERSGKYNYCIYMYDLSNLMEYPISTSGKEQCPLINGDMITWRVNINGNWDIIMTDGLIMLDQAQYVENLSPGEFVSVNADLHLPDSLVGGVNYYAGVFADIADDETNVYDNAKLDSTPFLVPDVDLIMSSIYAPVSGLLNKTISVSNTVKNLGKDQAQNFAVYYYLSKDNKIDTASDICIGERYIYSLSGNSSSGSYTKMIIPSDISAGSYYIGAVVDFYNSASETNEKNNIKVSTSKINIKAPDLIVKSMNSPNLSRAGGNITISSIIKNMGNLDVNNSFYRRYVLSKDSKVSHDDIFLSPFFVSDNLNVGSEISNSRSYTLPSNLAAGSWKIIAIVDYENGIAESDETNNQLVKSITIDNTKPTVNSSDPSNTAAKVARNKTITVTFNENIKSGTNYSKITLKSSAGKTIIITKSISGKVLTIKHSALMAANTKYTLTLFSGCVTDLAGNPVATKTISFTTGSS